MVGNRFVSGGGVGGERAGDDGKVQQIRLWYCNTAEYCTRNLSTVLYSYSSEGRESVCDWLCG